MALSTYTELKAAIADNAHRSDLTSQIVDAITMAEARMYDMLILKNQEADSAISCTIGNNYVALPTGFVSPVAAWLTIDSERVPLTFAAPEQLPFCSTNAQPTFCAIDGANLRFDCPADDTYAGFLRCVTKSNLSGSVASNYLLARRPDIYLAASLVELARYMVNPSLMAVWEQKFQQACNELKAAESRNRGIVPLRTDLAGVRANILRGD